ncbi:hypothetical protein D3C72_2586510 [compost metagenome]
MANLSESSLASVTIRASLANSEGWIVMKPKLIQRWAPRALWPATSTRAKSPTLPQ